MENHYTKICKDSGHPEICFAVAKESQLSIDWLRNYFESEVSHGKTFQSGETIQIGWMFVQLKKISEDILDVWEPDFDAIPIKWCRGVNNTLRHLILQRSVCNEIECEPNFPSLRQAGIASINFLNSENDFMMSRDYSPEGGSGWGFYQADELSLNGDFFSLYEIALNLIYVIPFLALPVGATVQRIGSNIELIYAGKQITSQNNDLLHRISEATILI